MTALRPVSLPQNVPDFNITNADDILDATAGTLMRNALKSSCKQTVKTKERLLPACRHAQVHHKAQPPVDYSFIDSPAPVVAAGTNGFAADLMVSPGQPTQQNNTFVANTADENDAEKLFENS